MKSGDKVFIVTTDKILKGTIFGGVSHKGVVTGYAVASNELPSSPAPTKFLKKDIFVDEDDAKKAMFLKKLKSEEKLNVPAEDKKGDRRWIEGHKRRGYGQ